MFFSCSNTGYPEETYPEYDRDCSYRRRFEKLRLEETPSQPTAEALAERMEQEEEEILARKLSIVQEEDEEEDEDREEDGLNEDKDLDEGEEDAEDYMEEVEEGMKEEEGDEEEDEEKKQLLSPASPAVERKQERLGFEVSRELQQLQSAGKKQISFSDQKRVFHYPKEDTFEEEEEEERADETEEDDEGTEVEEEEEAEDDPLTEAESLQFSCEGSSNPEEGAEEETEECLLTLAAVEGEGLLHADGPKNIGQSGLRMRTRKQT